MQLRDAGNFLVAVMETVAQAHKDCLSGLVGSFCLMASPVPPHSLV